MNRAKVRRSRFTSLHETALLRLLVQRMAFGEKHANARSNWRFGSRRGQLSEMRCLCVQAMNSRLRDKSYKS
jgi:hypothetical protein